MLSDHEQKVWDDIERRYAIDAGRTRHPRDPDDLPGPVVAGIWLTIALVLFGAFTAAVAVGSLTVLGWLLWRYGAHPVDDDAAHAQLSRFRGSESAWTGGSLPLTAALDPARWSGSRRGEQARRDL